MMMSERDPAKAMASNPRQKMRKRKLEPNDEDHSNTLPERRELRKNGTDDSSKTQKRPRSKRSGADPTRTNGNGSLNGNGNHGDPPGATSTANTHRTGGMGKKGRIASSNNNNNNGVGTGSRASPPSAKAVSRSLALSSPRSTATTVTTASSASSAARNKAPSGFLKPQQLRQLVQDSMQTSNGGVHPKQLGVTIDEPVMKNGNENAIFDRRTTCNNNVSHSDDDVDDCNYAKSAVALDRAKRRIEFLFLFTVAYVIYVLFVSASIVYTQNNNHRLATLQREASYALTAQKQSEAIQREFTKSEEARSELKFYKENFENAKRSITQLTEALAHAAKSHRKQLQEYKSVSLQLEEDLHDAYERIEVLRGEREECSSATDLAWLRMDELMEENNGLSNDLKRAKKSLGQRDADVARAQLQNKELVHEGESLARELKDLTQAYDDLLDRSKIMEAEHDLLQYTHNEIMEALFAPILLHVQKMQVSAEQQHGIIMELTSLVHSLHTSLELSRSDLEMQTAESIQAVDAMAIVTLEKSQAYELERADYMQHMELQLERLEDEAMGAVHAVSEAAGKLEYERKIEEESRWRSYVAETETILGGIRNIHHENIRDNGIGETSVLKAAIARRIEDGIASLKSYIHPYNYLGEEGDDPEPIESQSED
eukprot:CAMPEP_0183746218 /NCGR_PEP_ID=MMETSP0737-20130205/66644_1 /TAXON_ID=385413 /ORGANISM="Thalassiosira miniscula, Strain CCMP1093" /LENGTH=657 /DNA_ID=CAMNT_0025981905 /DNA_START=109 /DNA_END=2082 /DNA_ORIENTATION=+